MFDRIRLATDQQPETDGRPHHYERYRIAVKWSNAFKLPVSQRVVLFAVASHDMGDGCYCSLATLATETGLHRSTISAALAALRRHAIIYPGCNRAGILCDFLGAEFLETKLDDGGL